MPTEIVKVETPFEKMKNRLRGFVNPKAEADRLSNEMQFSDEEINEYDQYHQKKGGVKKDVRVNLESEPKEWTSRREDSQRKIDVITSIEKQRKNAVSETEITNSQSQTSKSNVLPLPTSFSGQEDTSDQDFEKQFLANQNNSQKVQESKRTLKTASDLSER